MRHLEDASSRLEAARSERDAIVVAFSGGKDALCTMDLCKRVFSRVEAFFMETIPGLSSTTRVLELCRTRFGVTPVVFHHWTMLRALGEGAYCDPDYPDALTKVNLADIHAQVRNHFSIPNIATGYKKADSMWRRRMMAKKSVMRGIVAPLTDWKQAHVIDYLTARGIPLPAMVKDPRGKYVHGEDGDVDLKAMSILNLYDRHPDDFAKLEKVFPYVRAAVVRREKYGIVV